MKFKIHALTTEATFERLAKKKTATGEIFIEVGAFFFPEQGWDDFVIAVLAGWIENSLRLRYSVIEIENRFMDGPWSFHVRREIDSKLISITLHRDDQLFKNEKFVIPIKRYIASLRGASRDLLNHLKRRAVTSGPDVSNLITQTEALIRFEEHLNQT